MAMTVTTSVIMISTKTALTPPKMARSLPQPAGSSVPPCVCVAVPFVIMSRDVVGLVGSVLGSSVTVKPVKEHKHG